MRAEFPMLTAGIVGFPASSQPASLPGETRTGCPLAADVGSPTILCDTEGSLEFMQGSDKMTATSLSGCSRRLSMIVPCPHKERDFADCHTFRPSLSAFPLPLLSSLKPAYESG